MKKNVIPTRCLIILLLFMVLLQSSCKRDIGFLFPIMKDRRIGFIDSTGKTIIAPKYWICSGFQEGVALVGIDSIPKGQNLWDKPLYHYNYLSPDGKHLFKHNLTIKLDSSYFTDQNKPSLLDNYLGPNILKASQMHFPETFLFYEDVAIIQDTNTSLFGFINRNGEIIIKCKYKIAMKFSNGLAGVSEDGKKFGFVNKDGKYAIDPQYDFIGDFSAGMAVAGFRKSEHSIRADYTQQGNMLISSNNQVIKLFSDCFVNSEIHNGFAVVRGKNPTYSFGTGYGYIDRYGKLVKNTTFDYATTFSEGLAAVRVNGYWGFIDTTFDFVIKPQYLIARPFSEGLAFVITETRYGKYIDKNNNTKIDYNFEYYDRFYWNQYRMPVSHNFEHGLAYAFVISGGSAMHGYINRTGKFIWFNHIDKIKSTDFLSDNGKAPNDIDNKNQNDFYGEYWSPHQATMRVRFCRNGRFATIDNDLNPNFEDYGFFQDYGKNSIQMAYIIFDELDPQFEVVQTSVYFRKGQIDVSGIIPSPYCWRRTMQYFFNENKEEISKPHVFYYIKQDHD